MFKEWGGYGDAFAEDVPYEEIKPDYKQAYWDIGFGLQKIDGLEPSGYLVELAKKQVAGELTHEELMAYLTEYHAAGAKFGESEEADFTSARIAKILAEDGFSFRPVTLLHYHKEIFGGIESFPYLVGEYRTMDMGKKEPILNGESVRYASANMIHSTLKYDFEEEIERNYRGMSREEIAHQVMKFISRIWQVHPFREGNTRTISTFAIKYLREFGFEIDNEPFKNHAKYLRNAFVLDNASSASKRTDKYLRMFTENIVLGGKNELVILQNVE